MSKKISTSSTIKPRTKNWTDEEDDCLVGLFKTQFEAGNLINGVWHKDARKAVVPAFNKAMNKAYDKKICHNRLKVLKQKFHIHHSLANKTGWGWDSKNHIPCPGDPTDWARVIEVYFITYTYFFSLDFIAFEV